MKRLWRWIKSQFQYDPPEGWYPSEYVWTVKIEYYFAGTTAHYYRDFDEDHLFLYIAGRPLWDEAEFRAKRYADKVRKEGFVMEHERTVEIHFPVQKVHRVTVTGSHNDEYEKPS